MITEKDPKFLKEKLERLEKVVKTSKSPSELARVRRCITKTRKRLTIAKKRKKDDTK
jgi:hypothetical protein